MTSSVQGAVLAAPSARGTRSSVFDNSANQEYQVILPHLPSGPSVLNTIFLHADVKARPYQVEDFRDPLVRLNLLPEVVALGAYQMNHLWAVTFKDAEAAAKLVAASKLQVKGRRCLIFDPRSQDVRLKLHWVLHNVPDGEVRGALALYGKVTEVTRDRWRVPGCTSQLSTTRLVTLRLKSGVTVDDIPHQLRIAGEQALVVVPGRVPLCLRCHRSGHIRRECRVPRCGRCRRYGHSDSECVRTYANVAGPGDDDHKSEYVMDAEDAESASKGKEEEGDAVKEATPPEPAAAVAPSAERPAVGETPTEVPDVQGNQNATDSAGVTEAPLLASEGEKSREEEEVEMTGVLAGSSKRTRDYVEGKQASTAEPSGDEPPAKAPTHARRASVKVKPNVNAERPRKPPDT
ncbi:uncharacterized protein LOC144164895 [Haemaphysalis longicornis]